MTELNTTSVNQPSQAVRAEAAAWIARLHGPDRTIADEQSFRRWLAANPMNAVAFERMTTLWEAGTRLKSNAATRLKLRVKADLKSSSRLARLSWVAAGIIAAVAVGLWYANDDAVQTHVGEQRTLTLQDGTRVTLNTATRLEVHYDKKQRRVELDSGEALFEVKAQPNRPFLVVAGESRITALGTAFVVRRDAEALLVTLVEGKVAVFSPPAAKADSAVTILSPGQRLTLAKKSAPKLDRPAMDEVSAWRQGVILMDRMPLSVAVAEMNRYSSVPLIIAGLDADGIQVSGIFGAGDSLEFAHALARSHGLSVVDSDRGIVLSRRQGK